MPRVGYDTLLDMATEANRRVATRCSGAGLMQFDSMDASTSLETLKGFALSLLKVGHTVENVARILDMGKGTITAWKAHLTRGSYSVDDIATSTITGRKRRVVGAASIEDNRIERGYGTLNMVKVAPQSRSFEISSDGRFIPLPEEWHLTPEAKPNARLLELRSLPEECHLTIDATSNVHLIETKSKKEGLR